MPNVRKPIPKTQQQLGNEQVVPTYQQAGNPNNFNLTYIKLLSFLVNFIQIYCL